MATGAFLLGIAIAALTRAAPVAVISNGTETPVRFHLRARGGQAQPYQLPPGEVLRVPLFAPVEALFAVRQTSRSMPLDPWAVYVFVPMADAWSLERLEFPAEPALRAAWREPAASETRRGEQTTPPAGPGVIPVKLFVDDEETAKQEVWEARLRKRFAAANQLIERHCGMRFEPQAFGTWDSDDGTNEFQESLVEFIREVRPDGVHLAIGFSSQYKFRAGVVKLGGIPAPFFPFLLIREWPQKQSEWERLEVLLHELGHYLGAAHSPASVTVMRPLLGDKQANSKAFRIGYDPINTLTLNLVAEEWRTRGVRHTRQLTARTKARLACIYAAQAQALPDDPAALHFMRVMGIPTARLESRLAEEQRRAAAARDQEP